VFEVEFFFVVLKVLGEYGCGGEYEWVDIGVRWWLTSFVLPQVFLILNLNPVMSIIGAVPAAVSSTVSATSL
jgi:hypothetical protein